MNDLSTDQTLSALMVEDESELRSAIESSLSIFGIVVHGVGNAADFRERLPKQRYDLAIVDLGLPDGDGLSLVRDLTDKPEGPGVIILTAASEIEDRIKGFATGADLYFSKPVDVRELATAAIRLAKRLRKAPSPEPAANAAQSAALWTLRPAQWVLDSPTGTPMHLTTKEMAFMETLAAGASTTIARSHVLNRLGYIDDEGGNRSLDALVRRLRIKADETLGINLPIRTVHGVGYIFSAGLKSA